MRTNQLLIRFCSSIPQIHEFCKIVINVIFFDKLNNLMDDYSFVVLGILSQLTVIHKNWFLRYSIVISIINFLFLFIVCSFNESLNLYLRNVEQDLHAIFKLSWGQEHLHLHSSALFGISSVESTQYHWGRDGRAFEVSSSAEKSWLFRSLRSVQDSEGIFTKWFHPFWIFHWGFCFWMFQFSK